MTVKCCCVQMGGYRVWAVTTLLKCVDCVQTGGYWVWAVLVNPTTTVTVVCIEDCTVLSETVLGKAVVVQHGDDCIWPVR